MTGDLNIFQKSVSIERNPWTPMNHTI